MTEPLDANDVQKSKSQIKRELADLHKLGERLLSLSNELLEQLQDERLKEAIVEARKLKLGNARKRQIQYVSKLLRTSDHSQAARLLEYQDSSSRLFNQKFHRLERWRTGLIAGDPDTLQEILSTCPQADHPHLRQLARAASKEATGEAEQNRHSRKLFRYLRSLIENEQQQ